MNVGSATVEGDATTPGFAITGGGIVNLAGNNSAYTAAVNVNNGTLRVSNTAGSGTGTNTVTVNAGGALAGSGTISGSVTLNALSGTTPAGILSPHVGAPPARRSTPSPSVVASRSTPAR